MDHHKVQPKCFEMLVHTSFHGAVRAGVLCRIWSPDIITRSPWHTNCNARLRELTTGMGALSVTDQKLCPTELTAPRFYNELHSLEPERNVSAQVLHRLVEYEPTGRTLQSQSDGHGTKGAQGPCRSVGSRVVRVAQALDCRNCSWSVHGTDFDRRSGSSCRCCAPSSLCLGKSARNLCLSGVTSYCQTKGGVIAQK